MEGDYISNNSTQFRPEFQSTPSAWRETIIRYCLPCCRSYFNPLPPHGGRPPVPAAGTLAQRISIHSLRMEGDILNLISDLQKYLFQSTPSAWRETYEAEEIGRFLDISIHSLRMEGDGQFSGNLTANKVFQSTPSAWRETRRHQHEDPGQSISIHSLRMEGDQSLRTL